MYIYIYIHMPTSNTPGGSDVLRASAVRTCVPAYHIIITIIDNCYCCNNICY